MKCLVFSDRDELEEYMEDTLWSEDSVTGNASGSYTCSAWLAEEYLCHNFDLLEEAFTEFGVTLEGIFKGSEYCDVTIRCYLLRWAISEALDSLGKPEEIPERDMSGVSFGEQEVVSLLDDLISFRV